MISIRRGNRQCAIATYAIMNSGPRNCRIVAVGALPYLIAIKYENWDGIMPQNANTTIMMPSCQCRQMLKTAFGDVSKPQIMSNTPEIKSRMPTSQNGVTPDEVNRYCAATPDIPQQVQPEIASHRPFVLSANHVTSPSKLKSHGY